MPHPRLARNGRFCPGPVRNSIRALRRATRFVGAGAGAAVAYFGSWPLAPYADAATYRNWGLTGAVVGALAGFILSQPRDAKDEAEVRVGVLRAYVPPPGGIGFRLSPSELRLRPARRAR